MLGPEQEDLEGFNTDDNGIWSPNALSKNT